MLLSVLFIPALCFAQVNITILSEADKSPIPYTPLRWKLLATQQILQSQSNEKGEISIYSQGSPLELTISYLGYEIKKDTFFKDGNYSIYLNQDLKYLPEAVITDQYTATNPEKSILKVIVIDEKKIKAMAAVNLNDVLSNQLNIKLGQDNLLGSTMSLMGISGQNVKILIDGVPVIGRQNGNIDLSQINMNDVEHIEIIEGPVAVAYGTNALAGAINIITKKKQLHRIETNVSLYYETSGKYNAAINLGLRKTNGVYHFSLGRNYFNGWTDTAQVRYQDWKPKEQYFGRFQYLRKIGLFDLNLKSELLTEKITNKGVPRMPYKETAFDEYYTTMRFDNAITATSKLPKNRYLNLIAAYNIYTRTKNRYLFNRVTLDKTLVPETNEQDTNVFNNFVFRGTYTKSLLNAKLNYQVGYDINRETGTGKKIKDGTSTIGDYAGFLSMEISPNNNFTLKPGIRYAYNTAFKTIPLPSLNIKYSGKKHYTFRTSYARGFRAPDLKELYLYFVDVNHNVIGNPNLKPEKSNNFQLSLSKKYIIKKNMLTPEIGMFYNSIDQRIILTNVQNLTYTYQNLDFFRSFTSNFALALKTDKITANIGYAMNTISTDKNSFSNAFTNYEVTGNLSYLWKKINLTSSLFSKTTSTTTTFIIDDIGKTKQSKIDGYSMLDITFSKPFYAGKFIVAAGIKNLTGITNIQTTGIANTHGGGSTAMLFATGRTFFFKLDYYFTKK